MSGNRLTNAAQAVASFIIHLGAHRRTPLDAIKLMIFLGNRQLALRLTAIEHALVDGLVLAFALAARVSDVKQQLHDDP